jgi:hypothetical protein
VPIVVLAFLSDPEVVGKTLKHLGLPLSAPALTPARSSPVPFNGGHLRKTHPGSPPRLPCPRGGAPRRGTAPFRRDPDASLDRDQMTSQGASARGDTAARAGWATSAPVEPDVGVFGESTTGFPHRARDSVPCRSPRDLERTWIHPRRSAMVLPAGSEWGEGRPGAVDRPISYQHRQILRFGPRLA